MHQLKIVALILYCLISTDSTGLLNQVEPAINILKNNEDLKEFFKEEIIYPSQLRFEVSSRIEFIDPQWFISEILEEKYCRKISSASEEYTNEFSKIIDLQKKFESSDCYKLSSFSDEGSCNLKVTFFPYNEKILFAQITPTNSRKGFTYGMDFLFFFDKNLKIKNFYFKKWSN